MVSHEPDADSSARRLPTHVERKEALSRAVAASRRALRSDPGQALSLAEEALDAAEGLDDRRSLALALRQLGRCLAALSRHREALDAHRRALDLSDELGDLEEGAELALAIGHARARLGTPESAVVAYRDALRRARQAGLREMEAVAHAALGGVLVGIGDIAEGAGHHRAAVEIMEAEEDGDRVMLAAACVDAGVAHARMGDPESALGLLERALGLARETGDRHLEASARGNLAAVCSALGRSDEAREHAMRALLLHEQVGDLRGAGEAMIAVADLDAGERPEVAMAVYRRAAEIGVAAGDPALEARALVAGAAQCARLEVWWDAIAMLDRAVEPAERSGDGAVSRRVHEMLAAIYDRLGEQGAALRHFKLASDLREHLERTDARRAVVELDARTRVDGAEHALERARREAEELREELDLRTRELAAMATSLVQREEALRALRRNVDGVAGSDQHDLGELVDRLAPAAGDDAWREFERTFDRLHPEFVARLLERFPKLTTTEVRICALLRGNMSSKEIANILYTSERTIENHRYRMRRKLGLAAGESLSLLLATL